MGILLAALLPPPTPFKIFVLAAGAFEAPVAGFTLAITIARLARYFLVGALAVRYGNNALGLIKQHWVMVLILAAVLVAASYVASRFVLRHRPPHGEHLK